MDIVMEAEKLNIATGNLILCARNIVDDTVTKSCSKLINQILEDQLSINASIIYRVTAIIIRQSLNLFKILFFLVESGG